MVAPLIAFGALSAAGQIGSGLIAKSGAERAAQTTELGLLLQQHAAKKAARRTDVATERAVRDLSPFVRGGVADFEQLRAERDELTRPFTLEDFEASPGFQFRLGQGEDAINRAAAARGNFFAPASVEALNRFNQGLAADEFQASFLRNRQTRQDRLNALFQGANVGLGAAGATANIRQTGAGQAASALTGVPFVGAGQAIAGFQQSGANALAAGTASGVNSLANVGTLNSLLNPAAVPQRASTFVSSPGTAIGPTVVNPSPPLQSVQPGFFGV